MYGKLSQHKSGDGCRKLTKRDKWVKESFIFLSSHIVRVVSRQVVSVSIISIENKDNISFEIFEMDLLLFIHYSSGQNWGWTAQVDPTHHKQLLKVMTKSKLKMIILKKKSTLYLFNFRWKSRLCKSTKLEGKYKKEHKHKRLGQNSTTKSGGDGDKETSESTNSFSQQISAHSLGTRDGDHVSLNLFWPLGVIPSSTFRQPALVLLRVKQNTATKRTRFKSNRFSTQISKELLERSTRNRFMEVSNQSTWKQLNHRLANNSRHNQPQGRPRTPIISAHFLTAYSQKFLWRIYLPWQKLISNDNTFEDKKNQ